MDGRRYRHQLELVARPGEQPGTVHLHVPRPGVLRGMPRTGEVLGPGELAGELEVLGQLSALIVPRGARGALVALAGTPGRAKVAVEAGQRIYTLDVNAGGVASQGEDATASAAAKGLVFRAPLGGRYYARATPNDAPFVSVGSVVTAGQTVALLEVMKTFNRVRYGGAELPSSAKVLRILPKDGDDVVLGDPLFELEPG